MRTVAAAAVATLLVMSACGSDPDNLRGESWPPPDGPKSILSDRVYEIGTDVAPGIYASRGVGCTGYTVSSAGYDPMADEGDPSGITGGSVQVRDRQWIKLRRGEVFTSDHCDGWWREDPERPSMPDPTTRAGGCTILIDDELAQQTLDFGRSQESAPDDGRGHELQERLYALVVVHNKELWPHAGELVDFLDDPDAYVTDGRLAPQVSQAMDAIRNVCRR